MIKLGSRLPDRDLHVLGLQRQGQVLVGLGAVAQGLELLDEVVVAVMSGELGINATAVIYCSAIATCIDLGDYGRAGEWSEAAKRWCEREASTGFPGLCRIYHGEIVRRRGAWQQAEQEVRLACDELQAFGVGAMAGAGAYQLGEICRLRGDLESADRGESRDRLSRARLLPTQIAVSLAQGDLDSARAASAELDVIAAEYRSGAFEAGAASARAAVALAGGDLAAASADARRGQLLWQQLGMPHEVACAQMTLGAAARAASDADTAKRELTTALESFRRLGADRDAARAQEQLEVLSRDTRGRGDHLLTARELEILRLVAEGLTDAEVAARPFLSPHHPPPSGERAYQAQSAFACGGCGAGLASGASSDRNRRSRAIDDGLNRPSRPWPKMARNGEARTPETA